MPLGYFLRPLFLLAVLYGTVLWGLRHQGFFDRPPPSELIGWRGASSAALEGRVASPLTENRMGRRVFMDAERIEGRPFRQRLLVYLPRAGSENLRLRPGMKVEFEGRLRLPRPARNPGDFDERRFLWDRGTSWIMAASSVKVRPGSIPWARRPAWAAETVRRSMEDCFHRRLPLEEARLTTGLVLGYRAPLDRNLVRAVQDAGVLHLLVPSGAKVAFVWLAASGLGLGLGLSPGPRWAAAGLLAGFYTLMVGADAPYARAWLGALALGGTRLLGREAGAFQALVLSALAILAPCPRELFTAGFQMTYLAVGGLVLAMPTVSKAIPRRWPGPLRRLVQLAAVGAVVQIMLWPAFADYFGRGSLIGPVANMVLVPYSGVLMAGGGLLWACDGLSPDLAALAAAAMREGVGRFRQACFAFASIPGAAIDLSPYSPADLAAYFLAAGAVLVLPRLGAAGVLTAGAVAAALSPGVRDAVFPRTEIVLLSLPRSRPVLVRPPEGGLWLVDPGGPAGTVLKALKARGVRRLDRVVVTGPGRERWGGLERLARELRISRLELPAPLGRAPRFRPVIAALARSGTEVRLMPPCPGPWRHCDGAVCLELGAAGPRVLRGDAEYSTIPTRLRSGALRVSIDGTTATIHDAR